MSAPRVPDEFKALIASPTSTICGNFTNAILKLPTYIYEMWNWIFDAAGNASNAFKQQITPPGMMVAYGGATAPDGWLLCQGQAVLRADYPELFTAIGTAYGPGNGTTTFNVPDGRCRAFIGAGTFESGATASVGGTGGAEKVALTTEQAGLNHVHTTGRFHEPSGNGGDDICLITTPTDMDLGGETAQRVNGPSGLEVVTLGDQTGKYTLTGEATQDDATAVEPEEHTNLQPYFVGNWMIKT